MRVLFLLFVCFLGCKQKEIESEFPPSPDSVPEETAGVSASPAPSPVQLPAQRPERTYKVVHVFVALCDNKHQGIVPVPAALGNGQDPKNNLYWGAMYGVKTYFRNQPDWKSIPCSLVQPKTEVLDWAAYKRNQVYVIAQAYDGARMKEALHDFFLSAAGQYACDFQIHEKDSPKNLQAGSLADMICFVGHNGLMDTPLSCPSPAENAHPEWAVVLACKSNPYFSPLLKTLYCKPLITTSGFMAPEAYTLEAVVRSWSREDSIPSIHNAAADAYSRYQKCSLRAAQKLFISYQVPE